MEGREDLLLLLKMRFSNLNPNKGLMFFGIPQSSLKEHKTNRKSVYENEPDSKYRLFDEEIKSQDEADVKVS